ncbi:HAD family hydrolase [Desulfobaculum bizertense]|uniref:HAD family hydrolase n=1 Tax=Desulfobaculum bizertense TaxID=376490 RepID=UPI001F1E16EF|nr:HAD-IA family hydrolase [Desulfobaculum bizertense]UIJ38618.1 HAD family hydrolase [Desulfobaculum bizertense]
MFICNDFCGLDFLRGLRGVVFDCDGVMFDTLGLNRTFYNLMLEKLDLPEMTREQELYAHAHTVKESLSYLIPDERQAEVPAVYKSIDYTELIPSMQMEEGLIELLSVLRASGVRLGIFTNRLNTMHHILEHFDLTQYFDPVMTAEIVEPKPHPEGLYRIMEQWGAKPAEIAYIGDTSIDARVARRAKVPFWAFKNEGIQADMYLWEFWNLRKMVLQAAREGGVLGTPAKNPNFWL